MKNIAVKSVFEYEKCRYKVNKIKIQRKQNKIFIGLKKTLTIH